MDALDRRLDERDRHTNTINRHLDTSGWHSLRKDRDSNARDRHYHKDAFKSARTACADFALVCREELKGNTAALTALGLTSGPASLALAAFLTYADTLFGNAIKATGDVKAILEKRGYTLARLTADQAKLTALRSANTDQESAKARAQSLTPQQRTALDTLSTEVNKLRKYARRALQNQPQLLEAIGIKA